MRKEIITGAFVRSLPILCSYLFVGMAYGIMMETSGFAWYYALLISCIVYTGAYQFVLITFLCSGVSFLTAALTAFLMNSRQSFYSLTFLEDFKRMGQKKLLMIHTLTDETFAVNCTLAMPQKNKEDMMFLIALFSWVYWMCGTLLGSVAGRLIPFELEGIDFCMTALFVIIFIGQWESAKKHTPAIAGLLIGIICFFIFGEGSFMLPALLCTSLLLLIVQRKERA